MNPLLKFRKPNLLVLSSLGLLLIVTLASSGYAIVGTNKSGRSNPYATLTITHQVFLMRSSYRKSL